MRSGWSSRPFARTFDLLASEYGWTDDQILDLTMKRMRQCREVCVERRGEDWKRELRTREAEVQQITGFVAGAAGWKAGVKDAQRFQLYVRTRKLPSYERVLKLFGR